GALKAAAKFAEAVRAGGVAALRMNAFELGSEFGCAAVIAGAENEIQQFFACRCVLRGAAKNGLEQADGFLSKTVAGKEVDVGERLRNEFLRVVVDRLFHESGNGCAACSARIGFDVAGREVAANFGAIRFLEFYLKRFERLGCG